MKKILITGGAGFIGSNLTHYLLERGFEVTVLDNLSNGTWENLASAKEYESFSFIKADIGELKEIPPTDVVFHLACLGVRHSLHSPFENHQVNASGTLKVLEASLKAQVKHFFYISTSEVYGKTPQFPITEQAPTLPTTIYGASKLAGEHYTRAFYECYGLNTTIIRLFNNYGEHSHYEGDAGELIPRTIVNVLNGKSPVVFGDGSVTRDFLYVKDTVQILAELIHKSNELINETINIGWGKEWSILQVIENILKLMRAETLPIQFLEDRPADVPRLWVDTQKMRDLKLPKPHYNLEEGLKATIKYFEEMMKKDKLKGKIITQNWK